MSKDIMPTSMFRMICNDDRMKEIEEIKCYLDKLEFSDDDPGLVIVFNMHAFREFAQICSRTIHLGVLQPYVWGNNIAITTNEMFDILCRFLAPNVTTQFRTNSIIIFSDNNIGQYAMLVQRVCLFVNDQAIQRVLAQMNLRCLGYLGALSTTRLDSVTPQEILVIAPLLNPFETVTIN